MRRCANCKKLMLKPKLVAKEYIIKNNQFNTEEIETKIYCSDKCAFDYCKKHKIQILTL